MFRGPSLSFWYFRLVYGHIMPKTWKRVPTSGPRRVLRSKNFGGQAKFKIACTAACHTPLEPPRSGACFVKVLAQKRKRVKFYGPKSMANFLINMPSTVKKYDFRPNFNPSVGPLNLICFEKLFFWVCF